MSSFFIFLCFEGLVMWSLSNQGNVMLSGGPLGTSTLPSLAFTQTALVAPWGMLSACDTMLTLERTSMSWLNPKNGPAC